MSSDLVDAAEPGATSAIPTTDAPRNCSRPPERERTDQADVIGADPDFLSAREWRPPADSPDQSRAGGDSPGQRVERVVPDGQRNGGTSDTRIEQHEGRSVPRRRGDEISAQPTLGGRAQNVRALRGLEAPRPVVSEGTPPGPRVTKSTSSGQF
jgi:hypothetical protein